MFLLNRRRILLLLLALAVEDFRLVLISCCLIPVAL